jgi:type II secretory pathway pseudopilin PulG
VVVTGILALAAVIVIPGMLGSRGSARLRAFVQELRGDLAMAKAYAARQNTTVSVSFDAAARTYRIGYWDPAGNPRLIKSVALPPGVRIDKGHPDYSLTSDKTSFTPRGGADNGTLVLTGEGGGSRKIVISILGKITLRD